MKSGISAKNERQNTTSPTGISLPATRTSVDMEVKATVDISLKRIPVAARERTGMSDGEAGGERSSP